MLFTMLSQPDVVAATALGPAGFLHAMRPGSLWVNSSTVNPSFARLMAEDARAKGVRYLDAPVTGSKDAAARGDLLFMVGGDASDLDACRALLDCMGKRIVHVGAHGLGSSLKMVNNLLAAVAMAAFAEGAALGQALGVPRDAEGSASRFHQRLRSRCADSNRERDEGAVQAGDAGWIR